MDFIRRFFGLTEPPEPTPRQRLEAHLVALRERRETPPDASATEGTGETTGPRLSVLNTEHAYRVVMQMGLDRVEVWCRAERSFRISVSCEGFFAEPPEHVSKRRDALLRLGLTRNQGTAFFSKDVGLPGQNVHRLARDAEEVLFGLFGHAEDSQYSVAIERDAPPDPAELLDGIRNLVKQRDLEARRLVYQHVINGRFYLPLKSTTDPVAVPQVHDWGEPFGGKDVWAVFTDMAALRDFRQSAEPYVVIGGIQLVRAAEARDLGALKINPKSKVGGELYKNEIDTLAQYLRKIGIGVVSSSAN